LRFGGDAANPEIWFQRSGCKLMKARVVVTLKSGVLDPQGKAIEGALASLGVAGVTSVRQGKVFDVEIAAEEKDARAILTTACERLLANTVIESFAIEMQAQK
jgi:phosphoribosylformylglycinamidine synthase subunit PurS